MAVQMSLHTYSKGWVHIHILIQENSKKVVERNDQDRDKFELWDPLKLLVGLRSAEALQTPVGPCIWSSASVLFRAHNHLFRRVTITILSFISTKKKCIVDTFQLYIVAFILDVGCEDYLG